MIKHLYQRTIKSNGKKIKAWYYWYYDESGKQVRKTCGEHGKPCILKRDAQSFIDKLTDDDLSEHITFNKFCDGFYDDNSRYLIKLKNRGIIYHESSLYQKRLYLQRFLERFGNIRADKILAADIENWLLEINCSNSVKNNILAVIREVEEELYSYHYINNIIHIKNFKRNTNPKGILYLPEIQKLFPEDYEKLISTWRIFGTNKESEIYTFATMIYTIISTGMRSCEIRALQWNQFIRDDAILINAMIDSADERVNHLKKGDIENKKWRVTILPDKTVRMIQNLKQIQDCKSDYVFTYKNELIDSYYLLNHFKSVLDKNGIDHSARNITIHSLRFTYNTMMRREITGNDLRLMMGHVSEQMTDYYDKSKALEHLPDLLMNKDNINSIFN